MPAIAMADMDVSGSVLFGRTLNRPAFDWAVPLSYKRSYLADDTIQLTCPVSARSLTAEEEELVWAALRDSSELVYLI
jgi:hypothetical protein